MQVKLLIFIYLLTASLAYGQTMPAQKPLTIALAMDHDPDLIFTKSIIRGAELAAELIHKKFGRTIVFSKYDTGKKPEQTQTVMLKVVNDQPDFIIGDIHSSQAVIGAKIAESANQVYMLTTSASSEITEGKSYVFRTCYSDRYFSEVTTKFLAEKGYKTAHIIYDSSRLYGTSEKETFNTIFGEVGAISGVHEINRLTRNYNPYINNIVESAPDVAFFAADTQQSMTFIAKLHLSGHRGTAVVGTSRFGNPLIEKSIQKLQPHFPIYWIANAPLDLTQNVVYGDVAKEYAARYKTPMNALGSLGFDSVMIFFNAVKDLNGFTQGQLADRMRKLPYFRGLSADFDFDGKQDPKKSVYLRTLNAQGKIDEITIAPQAKKK